VERLVTDFFGLALKKEGKVEQLVLIIVEREGDRNGNFVDRGVKLSQAKKNRIQPVQLPVLSGKGVHLACESLIGEKKRSNRLDNKKEEAPLF